MSAFDRKGHPMIGENVSRFPELGNDGLPLTALAREFYTSPEWFQRDMERVFRRRWLFACHVSEIPNPGDYTTLEIGGDSIIVARDQGRKVNAFHNVCRHRGSRLCRPGRGNIKAIVCPFHAWTYNLDGTLRAAPNMAALDRDRYGTKRVWSEVWNGMVFINLLNETPRPVAEYLENVRLSGYQLERAKVIEVRDYLINANWKINGETYQECYHCAGVHRNSLAKILLPMSAHEAFENTFHEAGGHDQDNADFLMYSPDLRKGLLLPGLQTQSWNGELMSKRLLGEGCTPQPPCLVQWFPSWSIGAFPDTAFIIDWIPISAGETLWRTRWLVHEDAVEGVDYNLEDVVRLADMFNREDKVVVEQQQAGVNSTGYVPGPLHRPLEDEVRKYIAAYISLVKG
jgi:Rieske 2Fe-2S family protein